MDPKTAARHELVESHSIRELGEHDLERGAELLQTGDAREALSVLVSAEELFGCARDWSAAASALLQQARAYIVLDERDLALSSALAARDLYRSVHNEIGERGALAVARTALEVE